MQDETRDDLAWLAFRYVNGEMTSHQRSRFEERLAGDEAACDAVEQAVELSEALCRAAERRVARRPWGAVLRRGAAWAACLMVAGGVAWLAWQGPRQRGGEPAPEVAQPSAGGASAAGVSLAWARLRDQESPDDQDALPRWTTPADPLGQDPAAGPAELDATEAEVPQWLLTAVSAGAAPTKEIQ